MCLSQSSGKFCAGNTDTIPDTVVVDSTPQNPGDSFQPNTQDLWTDAQPRDDIECPLPKGVSCQELPEATADRSTAPARKEPSEVDAQELESDLGESASVAPHGEHSKRDPNYWKFLGHPVPNHMGRF